MQMYVLLLSLIDCQSDSGRPRLVNMPDLEPSVARGESVNVNGESANVKYAEHDLPDTSPASRAQLRLAPPKGLIAAAVWEFVLDEMETRHFEGADTPFFQPGPNGVQCTIYRTLLDNMNDIGIPDHVATLVFSVSQASNFNKWC